MKIQIKKRVQKKVGKRSKRKKTQSFSSLHPSKKKKKTTEKRFGEVQIDLADIPNMKKRGGILGRGRGRGGVCGGEVSTIAIVLIIMAIIVNIRISGQGIQGGFREDHLLQENGQESSCCLHLNFTLQVHH